jgi:proline iminopeptidase
MNFWKKLHLSVKVFVSTLIILSILYLSTVVSIWPENSFFVKRDNAQMPVWVKGNIDSGVFIVFNHGGPGSCGTLESILEVAPANGKFGNPSPFQKLEEEFAIVYWDQRHSGQSSGNVNPNESKPEDFGKDLAQVIKELKNRYPVQKLIIVGQSWGYTVALNYLAYLSTWEQNQADIDALIIYKGNHEQKMPYSIARDKILTYAQDSIRIHKDPLYWKEVQEFYKEKHSIKKLQDFSQHYSYINEIMNVKSTVSDRIYSSIKASFLSPFNGWKYYFNNRKTRKAEKFMKIVAMDSSLRKFVHRIQIPTLLIYGKNDLVAPVEVGEFILNEIQTEDDKKKLVILENSRHGAENEDIKILQKEIKDFINKIR